MNFGFPNVEAVGPRVLVISSGVSHELALQRRLWHLARAARTYPGVREAVAGDGTMTMLLERDADRSALIRHLRETWNHPLPTVESALPLVIPVRYDGIDLDALARTCALNVSSLIDAHVRGTYTVSFVGFQPGFAYLEGLDARLHAPRRTQPRARVPAGSVAIAHGYSAVYPLDSPGGWNIIGTTEARLFDPARIPFALLAPGDRVRFVRV